MTELSASVIKQHAKRWFNGDVEVHVLDSVGSTNTWLKSHLAVTKPRAEQSFICAAEHQTAGRGRRGKTWHSPYRGVTFSIAITIEQPVNQLSGLSLLCGASVCTVLRRLGVGAAVIKWPNDVLVNNAKLSGILIEVVNAKSTSATVIAGIGVNYRRGEEAGLIDQDSTDLYELTSGQTPDRSALIGEIVSEVYRHCSGSIPDAVRQLSKNWAQFDALAGQVIHCEGNSQAGVIGRATGIDSTGRLLVSTSEGQVAVAAGNVSVRRSF